ncbi:MAG: hypothetical protein H6662_08805 [Ardenticatenaceae bacterium]|nr:hypothetical protein [Anaerolineales bacterium]MCB8921668.1 hypothetical protein [Ardenticatenaceae bacterium]
MDIKEKPIISMPLPTTAEIDQLVSERKLLRILHPEVQMQVRHMLDEKAESRQYVIENGEQLYLSFEHVEDSQQRNYFYRLIQRYQSGERVSLRALPPALQQLLQPELTRFGYTVGAMLVGAVAGIGIGILAMAATILVTNVVEWVTGYATTKFAGMEVTAVTFVVFSIVGWVAIGILAWNKPYLWGNFSKSAATIRRKLFR